MHGEHITQLDGKVLVGRAEWCQLNDLGLYAIKAKIDTGAKTSAIHAENIEYQKIKGKSVARFYLHPLPGEQDILVKCQAEIIDQRSIMSSNGIQEHRYIIETSLQLDGLIWQVHISLSNREPLRYRLLLGRDALRGHVVVDPARSCLLGKFTQKQAVAFYR